MTVYVVVISEHKVHPEIHVFGTAAEALYSAQAIAKQMAEGYGQEPEAHEVPLAGWLYYAVVSRQGDSVRVEEKLLE